MVDATTQPLFALPWPKGLRVSIKTYPGHNPDDKKSDQYCTQADGSWAPVCASAPGIVTGHYDPGGVQVRHFIPGTTTPGRWMTNYMHMTNRVAVGTVVDYGSRVGTASNVGTGAVHLHYEQLFDADADHWGEIPEIVNPSWVELGNKPLVLPLGEPGLSAVSANSPDLLTPIRELQEDDMSSIVTVTADGEGGGLIGAFHPVIGARAYTAAQWAAVSKWRNALPDEDVPPTVKLARSVWNDLPPAR